MMNTTRLKAIFLFTILLNLSMTSVEARPTIEECSIGHSISKTFASGVAWDLCWKILDKEGLVLTSIHYKPVEEIRRQILGEASLSQIQTEYDDGSPSEFLVTDFGLGGNQIQTLTTAMCKGGRLHNDKGKSVLCERYQPAGYIYRYDEGAHRQGNKLTLFSVSSVGSREFIIRWNFLENGTIQADIGIAGQFSKQTTNESAGWKVGINNKIMASFVDHFFWRLDFDLDTDSSNDIIEQIKSVPSPSRLRKTKETQTISSELAASFVPAEKKFWRVLDGSETNRAGQPISYEMVMLNYAQQNKGNSPSPWLKNDIYITRYKECERFAVNNITDHSMSDCGNNVSEFVNAENTNEKDIVVWYRLVHHTLPRDEDFYPATIQWSSFILLPRDWTSTNLL